MGGGRVGALAVSRFTALVPTGSVSTSTTGPAEGPQTTIARSRPGRRSLGLLADPLGTDRIWRQATRWLELPRASRPRGSTHGRPLGPTRGATSRPRSGRRAG